MSQPHDEEEIEQEIEVESPAQEELETQQSENGEIARLKELLARTQADYENFTKRTERDKSDMLGFLRADILKKIVPRLDDLERMISGTPEDMRTGVLYDGVLALQKSLLKDLEKMGVQSFTSKGNTVNPELHEVMTQVPGKEGIIIDEFEKGYMLGDKVLRVAKVVVGNGM